MALALESASAVYIFAIHSHEMAATRAKWTRGVRKNGHDLVFFVGHLGFPTPWVRQILSQSKSFHSFLNDFDWSKESEELTKKLFSGNKFLASVPEVQKVPYFVSSGPLELSYNPAR